VNPAFQWYLESKKVCKLKKNSAKKMPIFLKKILKRRANSRLV